MRRSGKCGVARTAKSPEDRVQSGRIATVQRVVDPQAYRADFMPLRVVDLRAIRRSQICGMAVTLVKLRDVCRKPRHECDHR